MKTIPNPTYEQLRRAIAVVEGDWRRVAAQQDEGADVDATLEYFGTLLSHAYHTLSLTPEFIEVEE